MVDARAGGLLDSIFKEADPYLTAATTYLDGAYDMFVGTPGRSASIKKTASGTTYTSININQSLYAEYVARKKIAEDYPDAEPEEIEKKVESYTKASKITIRVTMDL